VTFSIYRTIITLGYPDPYTYRAFLNSQQLSTGCVTLSVQAYPKRGSISMSAAKNASLMAHMRALRELLEKGDYFETIDNLEQLNELLDDDWPKDVQRSVAVACHKHLLQIRKYANSIRAAGRTRGVVVNTTKITFLLASCVDRLAVRGDPALGVINRIVKAESLVETGDYERALSVLDPETDQYMGFLAAEALTRLGRSKDAAEISTAARGKTTVVGYMVPNWDYLNTLPKNTAVTPPGGKMVSKRWHAQSDAPLEEILDDQISRWTGGPRNLIRVEDKIVACGSCFAVNLCYAMIELGMNAHHLPFKEDLNNTYANRVLFDKIQEYRRTGQDEQFMHTTLGYVTDMIASANVLVFTCGTSIGFFDENNKPAFPSGSPNAEFFKKNAARQISVAENVENLSRIIGSAKEINPKISIILTVSPVPLSRAFQVDSALIGDCISKSTLRVAINELLQNRNDEIFYWPSFEIAKWILPHYGLGMPDNLWFGADDGSSRHVSKEMVRNIVQAFLDYAMKS